MTKEKETKAKKGHKWNNSLLLIVWQVTELNIGRVWKFTYENRQIWIYTATTSTGQKKGQFSP